MTCWRNYRVPRTFSYKQLATDDFIASFDKDILKQILPHDEYDSLVLLSVFKKNFYTLDTKLNENYVKQKEVVNAALKGNIMIMDHINSLHPDRQ